MTRTASDTRTQLSAPYAEALLRFAETDWLRLNVPGHAADARTSHGLAALVGPGPLQLDVPPLLDGLDLGPDSPLEQALELAAQAWGARRTWFLTNGASQGNRIASLAAAPLGDTLVVQRSVHSSVIDGLVLSGLRAAFVRPSIDSDLAIAHGVTVEALAATIAAHPGAAAAYVVTPSYFGAVADVAGLARVAHAAGIPLIVDEAWGSHFGFHPELPANALSQGADLVISSTHKLGGSLTQSAMLHLGEGLFADVLEPLVERVFHLTQSTSASALLLGSLDLARRALAAGREAIGVSLAAAHRMRRAVTAIGRFQVVSDDFDRFPDVVATDPLRVAIDTRSGGISGHEARFQLMHEHQILVEVATDAAIVAVVGAGAHPDSARFSRALHALPTTVDPCAAREPMRLPQPGPVRMTTREAFLAPTRLVPAEQAVGRVSADTLAAYPPGIPNVLPGEVITAELVDFLQRTVAAPHGHVRGAADPEVHTFRVVDNPLHPCRARLVDLVGSGRGLDADLGTRPGTRG